MAEMMTLVDHEETKLLLHNKYVVVVGDSIHRSIYKDLVLFIQKDKYLTVKQLRSKGQLSFEGDSLVEGGNLGEMHNGTGYREVRQFHTDHHLIRFYFVTRIFSRYMESVLQDLCIDHTPDVVIINSCVWDISRYNSKWMAEYKENLGRLLGALKEILPEKTLVIWNLAMPLGEAIKGGFLVPEIKHKASHLRTDVIEGNFYALTLANEFGIDVLDLHYHFRHLLQHRTKDEVHWNAVAHRRITSLLILHIADAWNVEIKHSQVNVGQVEVAQDKKPNKHTWKRSGRYPAKVPYDGYRPEFISDSLPRGYMNFDRYSAPRGDYYERSPMYRCPLPPPPPPSPIQRRPYSHRHALPAYDERADYYYQPYMEHSHQAAMRSSHARHHYAPYSPHSHHSHWRDDDYHYYGHYNY